MGRFCNRCGEKRHVDHDFSLRHYLAEAVETFTHFDSKILRTCWLLVSRPGVLSANYLAGQRVRYVNPLRLYLLVSIIFFFAIHLLAQRANIDGHTKWGQQPMTREAKAKLEQKLARLPSEAQTEVRAAIAEPRKDRPFFEAGTNANDPNASGFEKWMNERVKEKIGENGVNLKVFFVTVVSNLPAMMLCCLPLSAFVLKVLYIRKRFLYIDHLIYALHIHSFAYLAIMIVAFNSWELAQVAPGVQPFVTAVLVIATILLVLFSIRRVYRQGWFITVLKFIFGGFAYLLVLLLALAATFFATLALPS